MDFQNVRFDNAREDALRGLGRSGDPPPFSLPRKS